MRMMEQEINDFMQSKLLTIKEDLLATAQQIKVKRNLNMLLEIDHGSTKNEQWAFKIEGKLDSEMKDHELLQTSNYRFLSYFERIKIDFSNNQYDSINWAKAKIPQGSNFDCIRVSRKYTGHS